MPKLTEKKEIAIAFIVMGLLVAGIAFMSIGRH